MRDNLFERLTNLSIGTGSQTPVAAITTYTYYTYAKDGE
jgi:hypothetical protein